MKSKTYVMVGVILTVLLLLIGIVDYYQNKQLNFYEAKNVIRIVKSYDEIEEDVMINDGKWLVLKTKDTIQPPHLENENLFNNMTIAKVFGERYFHGKSVIKNRHKSRLIGSKYVIENYRKELVPAVASDLQKGEAVEGLVYIYKVEKSGLKKWKTIDLFEIAKENELQGIPSYAYEITENEDGFIFKMEDGKELKRYALNIETEKLTLYQDTKKENTLQLIDIFSSYTNLNERPILKESGIEYSGFVPVITFEITESEKQSNVLLMEKYPELLDMQKDLKNGEKIKVYCLVDQPDVKEILRLLTPKEQDPFSYGEQIVFNRDEDINGKNLGTVVLHSYDQLEKESTEQIQRFEEINQVKENGNGAE